ncbi:hypothetical protein FQA47_016445 [Oryzias melastigma]|uniref:Uncharacterized protein n=1 Tax=Oryzias melastigma TaxID=30732 RepID=A0A834EYZ0_ORYME|nr:hypothetical protein FQA47_016445 [Oryzias melastigma]
MTGHTSSKSENLIPEEPCQNRCRTSRTAVTSHAAGSVGHFKGAEAPPPPLSVLLFPPSGSVTLVLLFAAIRVWPELTEPYPGRLTEMVSEAPSGSDRQQHQ